MPTGNRLSFVSTIIPNLSLYELFRKVTTLFSYLQEFSRKVTEKVVDSLYLLLFACFIFMLVNAFFVALSPIPVAIFSTTLLYIVRPAVLLALLFFNLTFIALGNSYIPTEELFSLVALIFTESSRQKKAVLLQNGETSTLQTQHKMTQIEHNHHFVKYQRKSKTFIEKQPKRCRIPTNATPFW